jgi:succinyl-CoA synthetase beta subunit
MRFYEHETKALFARAGLPLGKSGLARSGEQAREIAARIGGPVVLKSQVLSGGRMKAGAILFADAPEQAPALFEKILATPVKGLLPASVLVEEKSAVARSTTPA